MDNIDIKDLREVATLHQIGEAFGVSHEAVRLWEVSGKIPEKQLYRYSKGLLPDGKAKALKLYKRALKHIRSKQNDIS